VKKYFLLALILVSASLAVLARLKFNGLVYGLDFGIFHPDGVHYTSKALQLAGVDQVTLAQEVSKWYSINSEKIGNITPQNVIDLQQFYPRGRLLYPLLSVPFVYFFGISGMLVIPIVSYFLLLANIFYMGVKYHRMEIATFLIVILTISPTFLRWMINDCSDALFVALLSFIPLVLKLNGPRKRFILTSLVIILASMTRFSLPIFLSIAVVLLIQKQRFDSLAVASMSVISNLPALTETNRFFLGATDAGFLEKIVRLPGTALKVGFFELAQLAVLDRLLLFFLVFSVVLSALNFKRESSQYFIAIILSVWALGAINGTIGVNFRFQIPVLFFSCWVILENLPRFFVAPIAHVKVKETK
jgi:hypothetical protein